MDGWVNGWMGGQDFTVGHRKNRRCLQLSYCHPGHSLDTIGRLAACMRLCPAQEKATATLNFFLPLLPLLPARPV